MLTPPKQPALNPPKSRAIVCDDDPIMRSLIKARLSGLVDEVVDVADGLDAWRLLTTQTFHLALFDLMMPGLDGFALIQCVRGDRRTRHLPIVVLSSNDDKDSINRALAEGASSYLIKPLTWSVFSEHIAHIMRVSYRAKHADTELTRYRQLSEAHAVFAVALSDLSVHAPESIIAKLASLSSAYGMIANFDKVNTQTHVLDDLLEGARLAFFAHSTARAVACRGLPNVELLCSRPAIESVLVSLLQSAAVATEGLASLEMTAECTDEDFVVRISNSSASDAGATDRSSPPSPAVQMYVTAHGGQVQSIAGNAFLLRLPRDRLVDGAANGRAPFARVA